MRAALRLAAKDLKVELRSKEMLGAMFLFSLLVVLAFRFGFEPALQAGEATEESLAPAALWICFSFAAIIGMATSFAKEKDRETLDGLLMCPVDRSEIFIGKALSNLVMVFAVDVLSVAFFGLFFAFDFNGHALEVLGIALIGTTSLVLVGTIVSAISVNARAREVLLPVLLIPLIAFTVIIPCVSATADVIAGRATESIGDIQSILGFAVVFGAVGYLAFDYVFEG